MQTFSMEESLEPGFISINEDTEIKLEKLLAIDHPRMVKLEIEIKFLSVSRRWMIQMGFQLQLTDFSMLHLGFVMAKAMTRKIRNLRQVPV